MLTRTVIPEHRRALALGEKLALCVLLGKKMLGGGISEICVDSVRDKLTYSIISAVCSVPRLVLFTKEFSKYTVKDISARVRADYLYPRLIFKF